MENENQLDTRALRQTLGSFMTGVTVVTARDSEGRPRGLTANSFTSVSLDPPLILVCIGTSASSCDTFRQTPGFAVNILAEGQRETSSLFATKREDKFEHVTWSDGIHGAPILKNSLGWLDCVVHERKMLGDHLVMVGRVLNFGAGDGRPLGFYGGSYVQLPQLAETAA